MSKLPAKPAPDLKENLVVKSNELIMASYAMTVNEQRLLLACISQIDSRKVIERGEEFTLTVEQARDLFYDKRSEKNAYRDLKEATERLFERKVQLDLGDEDELLTRFIYQARFENGKSIVRIRFADAILPYLSQLEANFTQYRLANIVQLTSSHAVRIYELIVSWAGQGLSFKEMALTDFRELLGLGEKYKQNGELRRFVTDRAVEQINANTDFELDITFKKNRRTFSKIQLRFNRKADAVAAEAQAKAERLARQEHNTAAKAQRITAENDAAAEEQRATMRRNMDAYFAQFAAGSRFIDRQGKLWEWDGGALLENEESRAAIPIGEAFALVEAGKLFALAE